MRLLGGGLLGRILFCDDGSSDSTWQVIARLHANDVRICGIRLSRNKGHQTALYAGLMAARSRCDFCISLDADLQDDVEAIDRFISEYKNGCDVVFGVRRKRDTDTWFKKSSATAFYRLMNYLGVDTIENHADYRLFSRKALDALAEYRETNLFLRGLAVDLGFESAIVEYNRASRFAGESKYPMRKMLALAVDGITSFSSKPLTFVSGLGVAISFLSVFGLFYALVAKALGIAVSGWTATVASIWLLGGIQLLCIGLIGQYVGKTYIEVKQRPRYIVDEVLM